MKLVRCFNIRNLLEHGHQLWQIEKLGKPGTGTVAGALRGEFDGGGGFAKGRCPAVEMRQPFLLECAVLQIAHDRIQFRHGVAHGSSRCKYHAAPACDLVQIAALAEHIARFLGFRCGQTSDIAHFCG